jgi:hypothetical protein
MRKIEWLLRLATGEFFLDTRCNGSAVIVLRSLWTGLAIYASALAVRNFVDPTRTWSFSLLDLRKQIVATSPWLGPIFGAAYASFYARFSSQWSYLASLYNQIKQLECGSINPNAECIADLKAAFIEDAEELHLARKPIFASTIWAWAKDETVRNHFAENAPGGKDRLEVLLKSVELVHAETERRYSNKYREAFSKSAH